MASSPPPEEFEAPRLSRGYREADNRSLQTHHHQISNRGVNNQPAVMVDETGQREQQRLALLFAMQTQEFQQHLSQEKREKVRNNAATALLTETATSGALDEDDGDYNKIPCAFHGVEVENWESGINFLGCASTLLDADSDAAAAIINDQPSAAPPPPRVPLNQPRNPYLDNMCFDDCWSSDPAHLREKAQQALNAPISLEPGVAARSVARHFLPTQRPAPARQSAAYQKRIQRELEHSSGGSSGPISSTAELSSKSGNSLRTDNAAAAREQLIAAQLKKRAKRVKDKTDRVKRAMSMLPLANGRRGRNVTSTLMGPGGTGELTGQPAKRASHANPSAAYNCEYYMEQLDMVANHLLVRNMGKVLLRQYHRPKLPQSVVRPDMRWQLQICSVSPSPKAMELEPALSCRSMMMGRGAGSLSREKLRTEADLTPTEGCLILMEYCEERPPLQLTKGMGWEMVNYYRGDKEHCPISRGGGDRPVRRKRDFDSDNNGRASSRTSSRGVHRLVRRETTILDWVGKIPQKTQRIEKESTIDVLPEGRTEILHPKVHGPFIGNVEEGSTLAGCISNLFVAPMFRHDAGSTDFLLILRAPGGESRNGQRERMGVVLRDMPVCFTVGQTEPRARIYAPNTREEQSSFLKPFVSYQIARTLAREQAQRGRGLELVELQARVLPGLGNSQFRKLLAEVAVFDETTKRWTSRVIEDNNDYPGVQKLGRKVLPERVATFQASRAASRRLSDLGIHRLSERGARTVTGVGVAMTYLEGKLGAAKELARKTKKLLEPSRSNKRFQALQVAYYEKASSELECYSNALHRQFEIAQFIYEELQLAPWHLTGEFIDVHKRGEGTGMMKLTGLGDPSGMGQGFSFLRAADSKPNSKSVGNHAPSDNEKKIAGTEDDLRKLSMGQLASILRSYGIAQKYIDPLERWDRVHVLRDLSTMAAADGTGDGQKRFARRERMKLSEQQQNYHDRVQYIWKSQLNALSMKGQAPNNSDGDSDDNDVLAAVSDGGSDSFDDMDAELSELADEMMDRAGCTAESEPEGLRALPQDQESKREARELATLRRQRAEAQQLEERRRAVWGLQSTSQSLDHATCGGLGVNGKVIRKRVTKTYPDGRQTTTFKFILQPAEVGKTMDKLKVAEENKDSYEQNVNEKTRGPGHAVFEEDDDFEYSADGCSHVGNQHGSGGRGRRGGRAAPRGRGVRSEKLTTRIAKNSCLRKRKRVEKEGKSGARKVAQWEDATSRRRVQWRDDGECRRR